ncbi:MAG: DNA polymerase II [Spirochaetales bacterium]|nr:DNA polymerase II [Spirochaetales bacterium]
MSLGFASRTAYVVDVYSTDSRTGSSQVNILTLCCLDGEGYFEVEVPNNRLVFFIERIANIPELRGMTRRQVGLVDFNGKALDGLYFSSVSAFREGAKGLRERGVNILESDVQPDERFLMEHFIFRGLSFSYSSISDSSKVQKGNYQPFPVYKLERIEPADYSPEFRILSFDIETGQDGSLYCCGFHLSGRGGENMVCFMFDPAVNTSEGGGENTAHSDMALPSGDSFTYISVPTEKELLIQTLKYISDSDPDIIIGWNVIGFDFTFMENKCRQFNLPFSIGRRGQAAKIYKKRSGLFSAEAFGRLVIDGPVNLRGGFHSFEDYRLETVARELLGEGKAISGHAESDEKIKEIEERFRSDKPALALYNILDCVLVTRIFKKTALIEQLVTRSRLTGLRMDKVNQSVAAFDFFMLPKLHRAGYAAPDVADIKGGAHAAGGLVFTSAPGLYENILVMDFLSLYPSIIRTFMIDPLSRLSAERFPGSPSFDTPPGIRFSRDTHILPDHVGHLMESRAKAKRDGDGPLSQAVKILMNSYYGVMGTTGCRFYHPDLPTAITGTGQWILRTTSEFIRKKGFRVIYGDTDSVFVEIKADRPDSDNDKTVDQGSCLDNDKTVDPPRDPRAIGKDLALEINDYFNQKLKDEFGVESKLVLEVEKLYSRFFLPPMRGTSEGSRKKYAGLIAGSEEIEIKGLEYVRSDWTDLAKDFQMELFRRFFHNEEIPSWIKEQIILIRNGEFDDKLVYKKRLTKPAEEYVKNIPPHVKAARLLDPDGKRGVRRISYVMTFRGPIPTAFDHMDIDYSHYIEKQIVPLADTVLPFIGTSYDEIIDGRQGELF